MVGLQVVWFWKAGGRVGLRAASREISLAHSNRSAALVGHMEGTVNDTMWSFSLRQKALRGRIEARAFARRSMGGAPSLDSKTASALSRCRTKVFADSLTASRLRWWRRRFARTCRFRNSKRLRLRICFAGADSAGEFSLMIRVAFQAREHNGGSACPRYRGGL